MRCHAYIVWKNLPTAPLSVWERLKRVNIYYEITGRNTFHTYTDILSELVCLTEYFFSILINFKVIYDG